ncbi:MAG: ATP phosphoribosyltransferase [Rhodothermia bacterium]|nr:MAG: ATP phosphoribosyltransferase [Rhodothermia bacterium]
MVEIVSKIKPLKLGLPKGRMESGVLTLLSDAGIEVQSSDRDYRPLVSLANAVAKSMKPQNIVEMIALGRRDVGFAGADWVKELGADVVEILDTRLDSVRLVAAAPPEIAANGSLSDGRLIVTSEYVRIAQTWIRDKNIDADFVRSYGATEVFPPEDADIIIDNTATGATLRANRLTIIDTIMSSSTRLFASKAAMADTEKRDRIEALGLVLKSVLEARRRVMIEINASSDRLDAVIALLPCMREATVAPLFGDAGFAVRAAVPRSDLPTLLPEVKAAGGTDIVVSSVDQIVP